MVRKQRSEYIYRRAYELAASGLHLEPITIISALIGEGYPEAAEILDGALVRDDLRQLCVRHWPGVKIVTAEEPANESDPIGYAAKPHA